MINSLELGLRGKEVMIIKGSKEFGTSHHQVSVALWNSGHFWLRIACRAYLYCLTSALLMNQMAEHICYTLLSDVSKQSFCSWPQALSSSHITIVSNYCLLI